MIDRSEVKQIKILKKSEKTPLTLFTTASLVSSPLYKVMRKDKEWSKENREPAADFVS